MWQWLRRRFLTGFFVTVPLVVSVVAIVWVVRWADGVTSGLGERVVGVHVPGLGIAATAVLVLLVGIVSANVIGRRVLRRAEQFLMHVPLFRTVYTPVKQIISAFAPDSATGFKRVVLVEDASGRMLLGFLTREFSADRGRGPERFFAVYVPTNNLYLGDVIVCPAERVSFPDLSVEDGFRAFLTGGMGLPDALSIPPAGRTERRRSGDEDAGGRPHEEKATR